MTSAISNVVDRKMVQQNIPTNGFEPRSSVCRKRLPALQTMPQSLPNYLAHILIKEHFIRNSGGMRAALFLEPI